MTAPFRPELDGLVPYEPGRPVEIVQRELGIAGPIVKLASNEGPWGPVPAAIEAIVSAAADGNRYPDGGCYALRSALAERHGVAFGQVVVGTRAPDQRRQDGRGGRTCATRRLELRPRRARRRGERAHEARLRHQSEQPDGRHGDARGARALPGRPAGARPAGPRRGLLRIHRRSGVPGRRTRAARAGAALRRPANVLEDLRAGGLPSRLRALPARRRRGLRQGEERLRRDAGGARCRACEPRRTRRGGAAARGDARRPGPAGRRAAGAGSRAVDGRRQLPLRGGRGRRRVRRPSGAAGRDRPAPRDHSAIPPRSASAWGLRRSWTASSAPSTRADHSAKPPPGSTRSPEGWNESRSLPASPRCSR